MELFLCQPIRLSKTKLSAGHVVVSINSTMGALRGFYPHYIITLVVAYRMLTDSTE